MKENAVIIHKIGSQAGNESLIKGIPFTGIISKGDIVFINNAGECEIMTNNTNIKRAIGVVKNVSFGTCDLLTLGLMDNFYTSLTNVGQPVFLSSVGDVTQIRPTSGYLQILGFCVELNKLFVNIQLNRVKLL